MRVICFPIKKWLKLHTLEQEPREQPLHTNLSWFHENLRK